MQHKKSYITPMLVPIELDEQVCAVRMSHNPTTPENEFDFSSDASETKNRIANDKIFEEQMNNCKTSPF